MKAKIKNEKSDKRDVELSTTIDFLTMKKLENKITSHPTHDVKITTSFGERLMSITDNSNTNISEADTPSDILFAKTIPMPDFNIELVTEDNSNKKNIHPTIRVAIVDGYEESIDNIDPNDDTLFTGIGVVMFKYGKPVNMNICVLFGVFPNDEEIFILEQPSIYGCSSAIEYRTKLAKLDTIFSDEQINALARSILKMWYGIQISLLNPVITEGFHRETQLIEKPHISTNKNNKKKPIKYKKVVYLNDEFIDNNEYIKRIFNRKTQCWYVTGHWRNQKTKNGHKKMFIQGYWKGISRETKSALPREREILLNQDIVNG